MSMPSDNLQHRLRQMQNIGKAPHRAYHVGAGGGACDFGHIRTRLSRRVGTLIEATIYLQLIQYRYIFRKFTVLQCSHQHCVQPVASDVEIVGYL